MLRWFLPLWMLVLSATVWVHGQTMNTTMNSTITATAPPSGNGSHQHQTEVQVHSSERPSTEIPQQQQQQQQQQPASSQIQHDKRHSYLAMCLAVAHQNRDVREWVDYHRHMGASRFYIFDDGGDSDPASAVLQDLIDSGVVVYENTQQTMFRKQMAKYDRCIAEHRHEHQWIAFLDVDEFIVVDDPDLKVTDMLHKFEQYGGVGLNWLMYGSSGLVKRPRGGVGNYYTCSHSMVDNKHIKTIGNTDYVAHAGGTPHFLHYNEGYYAVNAEGREIKEPYSWNDPPTHAGWRINHYVSKSREDFGAKLKRGSGDATEKGWEFFAYIESHMTDHCPPLVR